jgi:hypothetical protein
VRDTCRYAMNRSATASRTTAETSTRRRRDGWPAEAADGAGADAGDGGAVGDVSGVPLLGTAATMSFELVVSRLRAGA